MPGKVNPVICESVTQVAAQVIGNDAAIAVGGLSGHLELNVFIPLIARNLLHSIRLLANVSKVFVEKCIDGIEADRERASALIEKSLAMVTALAFLSLFVWFVHLRTRLQRIADGVAAIHADAVSS